VEDRFHNFLLMEPKPSLADEEKTDFDDEREDPNASDEVSFPSTQIEPSKPPASYIKRADRYFNQLESKFTHYIFWHGKLPSYAPLVARWEWPPDWYRLTGFQKSRTIAADTMIRDAVPCICVDRSHVYVPTNPFVRSVVTFYYGINGRKGGNPIYIYEEFTFNASAEMTFIEAWSITKEGFDTLTQLAQNNQEWPDIPPGTSQTNGVTPDAIPPPSFNRLSTQIPGLGYEDGRIDIDGEQMKLAAKANPAIRIFRKQSHHFEVSVIKQVINRQLKKVKG
jgi:hypothetical protein